MGKYPRGGFVTYHCKEAFTLGSKCVDAVCKECKDNEENHGHSCHLCKQKMITYKDETIQSYMPRRRPDWPGPGPVYCGICEIKL